MSPEVSEALEVVIDGLNEWETGEELLHGSTSLAAIRGAQLADVLRYLGRRPGATVAEIAEAVDLPVWSVECRLAEHLGKPTPYRAAKPATQNKKSPYVAKPA